MKNLIVTKNLIIVYWNKGFVALCKNIAEQWIISLLIITLLAYLCSYSKTAICAWFFIVFFALYSAIKAVIEFYRNKASVISK